ncbi:MAG TPA: methylenetetrahydrofolate reductase C-terminal domain-containing protein [Rhodocyclaceae bacterium]|nr:methylenetetrahydrofolate reductase C-terminal domain-containing protein [Rhodocyclaceae bacterium]
MYKARLWSVRHARALRRIYDVFKRCAPRLAPLIRLVGARTSEAALRPLERAAKGLLFDCRMCGLCVLSATGMACPMNCAKAMRNGPCGGVRSDGGCEVKPDMPCVWIEAIEGGARIAGSRGEVPTTILPPVDHSRAGRSTWLRVISGEPEPGSPPAVGAAVGHEAAGFERACNSGRPVVTVEVAPPDSADPAALLARAGRFKGLVDAINITDGAGGNCHMSSVAASAILAADGMVPVYQIACRDRNRIAIQGDLLGAAALGVNNILCLTGDDVSQGDHPQAKPVFDLDAVSLLSIARGMRDRGEYASGRKLDRAPSLFIGATANPFVPPHRDRIVNLEKKVEAGAQFIQTQFCFDLPLLEDFMRALRARELHRRCKIIVGVGTLGNARALRWMAAHVPGIHIPEALLARIGGASDQKAEAKRACIEIIAAVAGIDGVAGVHVMGHRNEEVLAEIIIESGLRRGITTTGDGT